MSIWYSPEINEIVLYNLKTKTAIVSPSIFKYVNWLDVKFYYIGKFK